MVVMGSDANSKPWEKNGFNQTTPPIHPQLEGHFHAICTNPLVSNPGFKKNKLQGSPLGMGFPQCVRTSRLDILAHWCSWFQQPPVPRFRALGQQDPWQQFSGASRPRHLCLSLCVCAVFWRRIGIGRYINRRMKMCSLWEIRCFTRGYQWFLQVSGSILARNQLAGRWSKFILRSWETMPRCPDAPCQLTTHCILTSHRLDFRMDRVPAYSRQFHMSLRNSHMALL